MRLCLALGIDDPESWLDHSSPRKVALWEAYGELESFGEDAADLRNGMLLTAIDRFIAGEKSEAHPEQFSMRYKPKRKKRGKRKIQSADEQLAAFRAVMELHSQAAR